MSFAPKQIKVWTKFEFVKNLFNMTTSALEIQSNVKWRLLILMIDGKRFYSGDTE